MPLTWDRSTPVPTTGVIAPPVEGTERTPTFEPADFGESEGERTMVVSAAYDLLRDIAQRARAKSHPTLLAEHGKAWGHKAQIKPATKEARDAD